MANISKNALRSKITLRSSNRTGPAGMPHNAQDFSDLVGMKSASQQEFLRQHWEYLPEHKLARAERLSTRFKTASGPLIEAKTGQFALTLG